MSRDIFEDFRKSRIRACASHVSMSSACAKTGNAELDVLMIDNDGGNLEMDRDDIKNENGMELDRNSMEFG